MVWLAVYIIIGVIVSYCARHPAHPVPGSILVLVVILWPALLCFYLFLSIVLGPEKE